MNKYKLCSLGFNTSSDYLQNLKTLLYLIDKADKYSLIVAPEVCLTSYDYDNFEESLDFASYAIKEIKKVSYNKIIILTILERRGDEIFNFIKLFHNGKVVYERAKAKLFRFGNEHKYMQEGDLEEFKIVEIDGIKIAMFICFELRFKDLWIKSEGADVIAVSAWWGKARKKHFKILLKSLALINQCYVVASDSKNEQCTKVGAIISPNGDAVYNGNNSCLSMEYNKKDISLMRRYMDVGI